MKIHMYAASISDNFHEILNYEDTSKHKLLKNCIHAITATNHVPAVCIWKNTQHHQKWSTMHDKSISLIARNSCHRKEHTLKRRILSAMCVKNHIQQCKFNISMQINIVRKITSILCVQSNHFHKI